MKNIHLVPTERPSRLALSNNSTLTIIEESNYNFSNIKSVHLYITSDEEIEEGEYGVCLSLVKEGLKSHLAVFKMDCDQRHSMELLGGRKKAQVLKIILTTDQDLIKDGVQAIDDEFLEWFVKNPSCEFVKTELVYDYEEHSELTGNPREEWSYYKIIIPQEEPKQEALEEAAEKWVFETNGHKWSNNDDTAGDNYGSFVEGAKWQAKRM